MSEGFDSAELVDLGKDGTHIDFKFGNKVARVRCSNVEQKEDESKAEDQAPADDFQGDASTEWVDSSGEVHGNKEEAEADEEETDESGAKDASFKEPQDGEVDESGVPYKRRQVRDPESGEEGKEKTMTNKDAENPQPGPAGGASVPSVGTPAPVNEDESAEWFREKTGEHAGGDPEADNPKPAGVKEPANPPDAPITDEQDRP